ncbi:MAG: tRNA-splicing endonuclease [Candidatus Woesearchaeota archaeon]|nr:tRNA-splicing endonuclease [Candidatus Woesearchaeota archaeon]
MAGKNKEKKEKTKKKSKNKRRRKQLVKGIFSKERVITEDSDAAREFYNQSCFGKILDNGKVQLSLCEGLYLMEKGKLDLRGYRKKKITSRGYIMRARKVEPNFWIRYCVYKNMRNRGYVVKTALKFGADFRVYDRGIKPGEDHARWIIYPVHEGNTLTWYEFAAKNRVAHSTKKRLLIGVVDDEGDVTYYEIRWMRP